MYSLLLLEFKHVQPQIFVRLHIFIFCDVLLPNENVLLLSGNLRAIGGIAQISHVPFLTFHGFLHYIQEAKVKTLFSRKVYWHVKHRSIYCGFSVTTVASP